MQTFTQEFHATLTHQDIKQHLPHNIQVPPGTRSLKIQLVYNPFRVDGVKNLLTLTVFDPRGFRGAAHRQGNLLDVTIQEDTATPGFFSGLIQPGAWDVQVDTHMIMAGPPLQFELTVTGFDQLDPALTEAAEADAESVSPADSARRGPGWYRGDLHAHTRHSDGSWDIDGLVEFARANRLDFVTLSDHNTVSGLAAFEKACLSSGLLPVLGSELTTFWGHALALGRREWVDWRVTPGQREMSQIAAEVQDAGGVYIIAHPQSLGDPYCTGCSWGYSEMRPGPARIVEIWNEHWHSSSNNELALELAYEWMKRGLRMVLTAGTDRHGKPFAAPEDGFNVVYASDLTEAAILSAVRAGRLYLTSGPDLRFTAQAGGQTLLPGDSWRVSEGASIQVAASWNACPPGSRVELVVDGAVYAGQDPAIRAWEWSLPGGRTGWALLTVRDELGEIAAITNPIYFDGR